MYAKVSWWERKVSEIRAHKTGNKVLKAECIKSDYFVKVGNVLATMFRHCRSPGAAKRRKEGEPIDLFGRMSKSHSENKTKTSSRWGKESLGQMSTMFWTWLLATKSPCMFLAWPPSKEELVPGNSSHNPHLFWTQPRTRVLDKDLSLFKSGDSLFFEIGQTSDDSPYRLSLLVLRLKSSAYLASSVQM